MSSTAKTPPAAVLARFPEQQRALTSRYDASPSFREICRDYEDVVSQLANVESSLALASELRALAAELESEIVLELIPADER